jgi:hypothetical protein
MPEEISVVVMTHQSCMAQPAAMLHVSINSCRRHPSLVHLGVLHLPILLQPACCGDQRDDPGAMEHTGAYPWSDAGRVWAHGAGLLKLGWATEGKLVSPAHTLREPCTQIV